MMKMSPGGSKAQQNSTAIKAELGRLREVFGFDVAATTIFVLVASNGAFGAFVDHAAVDQYLVEGWVWKRALPRTSCQTGI